MSPTRSHAYYRGMVEAMRAVPDDSPYWQSGTEHGQVFHWSAWKREVYDPSWPDYDQPPPLAIDGKAYRRKVRTR